jgi:hypothetical protein
VAEQSTSKSKGQKLGGHKRIVLWVEIDLTSNTTPWYLSQKNKFFAKKSRNMILPQLKRNKNYQKLLKKKGDNES